MKSVCNILSLFSFLLPLNLLAQQDKITKVHMEQPKYLLPVDSMNLAYYDTLRHIIAMDTTIKDYKYISHHHKNGVIKDQHVYVTYRSDSVDRFWKFGKCFHYYPNGALESSSEIDPVLHKHVGTDVHYSDKGDTLHVIIWDNHIGETHTASSIFKEGNLGRIYVNYPDKSTEVYYKKGKRKKAITTICNTPECYTPLRIYYNKDGGIRKKKETG